MPRAIPTEEATSEYQGLFAEIYDLLHPTAMEAAAYAALACARGGDLLELGSGTGRLLLPVARRGVRTWGIEAEPEMLRICARKLTYEKGTRVSLVRADMRRFRLRRSFGVVLLACNTTNHLLDEAQLEATLRCARAHLGADGRLVLDNSIPDLKAMRRENGVQRTFEGTIPGTRRRIVSQLTPVYDFGRQLEVDDILVEEFDARGPVRRARTRVTLAWRLPHQLEAAVRAAGFRVTRLSGSAEGGPFTGESRELVLEATPA